MTLILSISFALQSFQTIHECNGFSSPFIDVPKKHSLGTYQAPRLTSRVISIAAFTARFETDRGVGVWKTIRLRDGGYVDARDLLGEAPCVLIVLVIVLGGVGANRHHCLSPRTETTQQIAQHRVSLDVAAF
jgi:hypothetical protein